MRPPVAGLGSERDVQLRCLALLAAEVQDGLTRLERTLQAGESPTAVVAHLKEAWREFRDEALTSVAQREG